MFFPFVVRNDELDEEKISNTEAPSMASTILDNPTTPSQPGKKCCVVFFFFGKRTSICSHIYAFKIGFLFSFVLLS